MGDSAYYNYIFNSDVLWITYTEFSMRLLEKCFFPIENVAT